MAFVSTCFSFGARGLEIYSNQNARGFAYQENEFKLIVIDRR